MSAVHVGVNGTHWLLRDASRPGHGVILYVVHGQGHVFVDHFPIVAQLYKRYVTVDTMWEQICRWAPIGASTGDKADS